MLRLDYSIKHRSLRDALSLRMYNQESNVFTSSFMDISTNRLFELLENVFATFSYGRYEELQ